MAEMKAEQDKWEGIPDWKRKLIMEKERKKSDDTVSTFSISFKVNCSIPHF